MKKRVTGIGGLFFKTKDPNATKEWYKKHLGFPTDNWGCTFWWKENLVELLKVLKEEGVTIVGEMEEYDYGKFGWIMDNDGNKIELWEPKDAAFQ